MEDSICAVIISYNAAEELVECINSVFPQVNRIIIIDNNSEFSTIDINAKIDKINKIQIIYNDNNMGVGYAFNQGIEFSISNGYKWTLLLDQDSVLDENMVQQMLASYKRLEGGDKVKTALLVPRIIEKNFDVELPAIITSRMFNRKLYNPSHDTFIHFQITSGSLLDNEKVTSVGLLNERLFIDYIDFEYCFRILDHNYKIMQCKSAYLYHSLGESRKKYFLKYREHSPLRVYYQTRNRLYIIYKYGSKYTSVRNSEIVRMLLKLPRIMFLESNKIQKIRFYFSGILDFARNYKSL